MSNFCAQILNRYIYWANVWNDFTICLWKTPQEVLDSAVFECKNWRSERPLLPEPILTCHQNLYIGMSSPGTGGIYMNMCWYLSIKSMINWLLRQIHFILLAFGSFEHDHSTIFDAGFEVSLIQSSEMSKYDSRTSGLPAGLVWWTTRYFWFSPKLHWPCIFQTSEWCIRTTDFYNPLARWTSAFNLKFWSLWWPRLRLTHVNQQYWKFPQVRQSKAVNFGGGLGTFYWFFFNFMFSLFLFRPLHRLGCSDREGSSM